MKIAANIFGGIFSFLFCIYLIRVRARNNQLTHDVHRGEEDGREF